MALPLARGMGAELLIGGYITYYFDGGTTGDSRISLQLEVYDVKRDDAVEHGTCGHDALSVPARFHRAGSQTTDAADPMGTLITSVAGDMARLLHMWTAPEECPPASPRQSSGDDFCLLAGFRAFRPLKCL